MKYHCSRCKKAITEERGKCKECKQIEWEEKRDKLMNRKKSKYHNTIEYGVGEVRRYAEGQFWASAHEGCFRAGKLGNTAESEAHIRTKFERWLHHRSVGRSVFTELRLKNGMGRPDLVIVDRGFIFVEEVVCSEKEKSIVEKKNKYPWPINVILADKARAKHA